MTFEARSLQRPAHAARPSVVAPFALLRAATLPMGALDRLRLPQTERLLARIAQAQARMETVRAKVEAALHGLVPALETEKKLRHAAVNLKRDVHNGRGSKLSDEVIAEIAGRLGHGHASDALEDWRGAARDYSGARTALDETVTEETQSVLRPALRAALDVPHFARAVALSSPRTARMAAKEKKLPKTAWPDKLERSLLGYIARASAKTSPFSSFMSVSTIAVDAASPAPAPQAPEADYDSIAAANRGIAAQFERLGRETALRASGGRLTVNPTLRSVRNGRFVALCNEDVTMAGRGWSEQRLAQFRLGAALGETLTPGLSDDWDGWAGRLAAAGVPRDDTGKMISTLLSRGVLTAQPVIDAFTGDPLDALAAHWRHCGDDALHAAASDLDTMADAVDGFGAAEGNDRLARLSRVEETAADLRSRLAAGARAPDALTNAVTEDCWLGSADGTLGADLMEPLSDLEDFLSSQVAVAPAYTRLVEAFVETFGAGASCDTVVEFLTGAAPHLVDIPEFGARVEETPPEAAPEGARIPVTAHFQIAHDATRGDTQFVMNRVFDGAGWLAARFTRADHPQADRLTGALEGWLATVADGAEPVDLPVAAHASDLQAHRRVTHRALGWPGEPLTLGEERIVDPAALRLHHDRATNLLSLTDAGGRPISLQYIGNTFPNPTWGVRYALSILSRPFAVARPSVDVPSLASDVPVHPRPARRHGKVVLTRPGWWVSSAHIRETWLDGTPAEQLVATARDCARHGLPPCFYAQIHVPMQNASLVSQDMLDANRKPIWIDTRNPFWLAMLERLARKADWLVLSAPCPGPDALWFEVAGHRHVSEIHLEMLVRAGQRRRASD
ncbi:hypothetical protein OCH239_15160 [Roseivivax halodurans JCM 10272]|uniref:Lantibiotic dehydratase N-terminal domain-containing protein n=1 Tax=Roseivivax halodurans JCM 10272 TaxID=1449350 RepID=X7EAT1_9RHOB|nr:lantibiotic dehydratase [Roseivivax halodurans]ETX12955.1 hypothetical protein OCH239_15160 [Roseivivax halodurans JCM 10272]